VVFYSRAVLRQNSKGQVLAIAAIGLTSLVGFAALATDVGLLYVSRRQMQTAADAAAVAGANALLNNQSSYQQAATQVTSLNGFTNGQNNVTVTIGEPANPPNPSTAQYVEADITRNVPVYFLSVLGYSTIKISVSAVAGTINSPNCIYALDSSAPSAINLTGNFSLNASCGLIDCSTSATALTATGNGTVQTTSTGIAGNYSKTGNVTFTPTPKTGIAPVADPLASLTPPSVPTCSQQAVTNSGSYTLNVNNQSVTVPAAIYRNGITIQGNTNQVTFLSGASYGNGITLQGNLGGVTFNPGSYQSGGSGNAITIAGNATTTFNTGTYTFCGPLAITGNNSITLSPGLYYGGINISGNATVSFNPGTYVIAGGGFSVTGNSNLSGQGVTFYLTTGSGGYGPINITGNATINFSAPTSGSLEGILFFQDRSIPSGSAASTLVGNASSTFDGAVYLPTTGLTFVGNSSSGGYTFLIADTITMTGNSSTSLGNNYSSLSDGSPVKSTALYE
jgi:Putative Flp pilus-assembly TadE/G-like